MNLAMKNRPVILCMHGMLQPWESLYSIVKPLEKQFRLIIGAMDGFYDGSADFTSFSDQAEQIETYIKKNHAGKIYGAYGFSQGALLVIELLTRNRISIHTAVLEGTYVAHQGRFVGWLTYHVLTSFKNHLNRPPKIMYLGLKGMEWTGEKARKGLLMLRDNLYWNASRKSIQRNCQENYTYHVRPELADTKTEIQLWCGDKERYALKSHKIIKKYITPKEENIQSNMAHGELAASYPKEHSDKLLEMFTFRKINE